MSYKKLHEILKKKIEKDYGPKCKDTDPDCPCCGAYLVLKYLEEIIKDEEWGKSVR